MQASTRRLIMPILAGLVIGAGLLAYANTAAVTAAASNQKLKTALKACQREKTESARKLCKKKAIARFKPTPGNSAHGTTTTTGSTTPVATTTGTTATTPGATTGAVIITGGAEVPETGAGGGPAAEEQDAKAAMASETPAVAQVAAGKALFQKSQCPSCHGPTGEGGIDLKESQYVRAQSVKGVIEQLILPLGHMPNFFSSFTFEQKEQLGDYICGEVSKKCEETP